MRTPWEKSVKETLPMDPDVGLKRALCCERFATDFTRKWLLTLKNRKTKIKQTAKPPPPVSQYKKRTKAIPLEPSISVSD